MPVFWTGPVRAAGDAAGASGGDRPNILWIVADDLSPALGCYGDEFVDTPRIDGFARESVRYRRAFATAPVCSPSRACLINGLYAPTQGTHNMRSTFPIPAGMRGFPSFLRDAGYYTTNNSKTDYNSAQWKRIIEASWDESSGTAHWSQREEGAPFFSVINLMTTHQSRAMVWPYERFVHEVQSRLEAGEVHDPEEVPVPPYYPDTPVIRRTLARYYDCISVLDRQVGAILERLEEDGLADDTIVFFYSDHGSGLPRHKRALLDTGMRVPLLVRFPERWRHLAPGAPGTATDRLVCFEDFGPSVLSLAGVEVPDYMRGRPFLGERSARPRRYVYGHRDRVDEVFDMARSVRGGRYLYIRNYMPHLGYNQPTAWPDQGAIRHEIYRLTDRDSMTGPQWHFAGPARPVEELYDCEADPRNLENLAASPEHREILERMRGALEDHLRTSRDLGFVPEARMRERTRDGTPPMELARREGAIDLERLREAASLVGTGAEARCVGNLRSGRAGVRYWGAVGLSAVPELSPAAVEALEERLDDESACVRIEAANALARHGRTERPVPVLAEALASENLTAVLQAARAIELLGAKAEAAVPAMRATRARLERMRPEGVPATVVTPGRLDMAMFIGFAVDAFLAEHGEEGAGTGEGAAWIELFDGETREGWKAARGEGEVEVVDGEIRLLAEQSNLWLAHEKRLRDFVLEAEARMPEGHYNSGLAFRCTTEGRFTGYQCEIDGPRSGMVYAIGKGWVWPEEEAERARFARTTGKAFEDGAWNRFEVRCEGDRIRVWVNGVRTTDIRDSRFREGVVAIQHHGRGGVHRFRRIRVRVLETEE